MLRICFLCVGREAQECTAKPVWTERGRAKPRPKPSPDQGAERESGCMGGRLPDCFAIRETLTPNTAGTCRPASTNCLWDWVVVGSCMFGVVLWLVLYNTCPFVYVGGWGSCSGEGGVQTSRQPSIKPHCLFLARVWVGLCLGPLKSPQKATIVSVWLWLWVWAWLRVTASRHLPLVLLLVCLVFVCVLGC